MKKETVEITTEYIKLDSFLKLCGAAQSGGSAKEMVAAGNILVNGEPCTQRGRKLRDGFIVTVENREFEVKGIEA
ncbi:MAG: RNA-binding S4 domain-containing protein [Angelakisella sp.]